MVNLLTTKILLLKKLGTQNWESQTIHPNDPKFSDRQVCTNSLDQDYTVPEQSDQGLQSLPTVSKIFANLCQKIQTGLFGYF